MFKGSKTQHMYEEYLKKGLCEHHAADFNQEDDHDLFDEEYARRIILFIRIGVLNPIIFKKPAKCDKIDALIKTASNYSSNLTGNDVADEEYDFILLFDAVIVFVLCHLSKICCIGVLFDSPLEPFTDPAVCNLLNLLHTDCLNETFLSVLNPDLEKNFAGIDMDVIKICYATAVLFVRNVCLNLNIRSALQTVENDILCFTENDLICYYKVRAAEALSDDAVATYTSGLKSCQYSDELYSKRGEANLKLGKIKAALLDFSISLMIKPACETFLNMCEVLSCEKHHKKIIEITDFAMRICKTEECETCKLLECTRSRNQELLMRKVMKNELCNGVSKKFVSDKLSQNDTSFPELVEDSDSTESESETYPVVADASDNENTDPKEIISKLEVITPTRNKMSNANKQEIASYTSAPVLVDASDSESTDSEELITKPEVNTPTRAKMSNANKQKKASNKPSAQVEEKDCVDITVINSYLKEASEALLDDCGYKALNLFRGSLRSIIESPKLYSSVESEIVCLKYAYAIAYCQSGEFDDLQKCITIFKEIIEKHDSITFPAAYYGLGLTYRKLNRFKEALVYLEKVKSILDKGILCKVYPWPAVSAVINETKSKVLQGLVNDLIKDCENPPSPIAICRFPECEFKSIYYTDPDFKGYMSMSCSEQCGLQYHMQCWKFIRTEKKLTDKDFLEKQCFTPDCDGVIVKILSIDKKGDISKEFLSEVKKLPKQKWAKLDKKTETKEKDKKKKRAHSSRSESRDNSSECEKVIFRKDSDVKRGSVSSLDSSAPSSYQEENLPINQQNEQQKFPETYDSSISDNSEPVKEYSIFNSTEPEPYQSQNISETYTEPLHDNDSKLLVSKCITNNIYSYMSDFLQCHGPLKIDDPILTNEMTLFPEDICTMIAEIGGIAEFLKNDLRFAYVGDTYVCIVADLGKAYAMHSNSSLPTGIDSLNSAEDSDYSKIRLFYNNEPYETSELNPEATEYMPGAVSETNNNTYFKITENSNSDISANSNFVTKAYELFPTEENDANKFQGFNNLCISKIFNKRTVDNNLNSSKSISLQALPSKELEPSNSKARRKLFEESKPDMNASSTSNVGSAEQLSESNPNLQSEVIQTFQSIGENLVLLLNSYFSENMEPHRQSLNSFIEPYIVKKIEDTTSTGTITDELTFSTAEIECAVSDEAKALAHTLSIENDVLSEQRNLLQVHLTASEQKNKGLIAEVSHLKKKLEDSATQIETFKKEYAEKEKGLETSKQYLIESLTHAHETIAKQRKEIDLWQTEKNSILKTIDELTVSLEVAEEKLKSNKEETETKQAAIRNKLQSENATLKARALYADRQFLSFKKTEYLKRIDEKILQAAQGRKELTNGLSMMCGSMNPVIETSVKSLAAELSTYENKLSAAKFNFSMKIDEQIKKIENGATLLNLEEIKMETIPNMPCWRNALPSISTNFDKLRNSNQVPFNSGWSAGTLPGLATAAVAPLASSVASSLASVSPSLASVPPSLASVPPSLTSVPPPLVVPPPLIAPPPNTASISKTPGKSSNFEINKKDNNEKKAEPLDILDFNPDIQESYKSAMASINSFASTPLSNSVPSLEDDLNKSFVGFKQPTQPVSNSSMDVIKVPPGIKEPLLQTPPRKTLLSTPPRQTLLPTPIQKSVFTHSSAKVHGSNTSLESMAIGSLDSVSNASFEHKKKTVSTGKNNYEKLLFRLKEQYPSYTQDELMSFVKEFRSQRQGKLSGLPIDTIIICIGDIIKRRMNAEKRAAELKTQSKSNKVLVNKKLVPDTKPKDPPQSGVKKKCPWNIESDSQKQWTGNDNFEECVICYNEINELNSYKVACGHVFHEDCIRQWLNEKSDCPICRVLLLLPEDYPSLS